MRFRDKLYVIPFGRFRRYQTPSDVSEARLIGRDSERAYLIDNLAGNGKQGAYLITGRRGVGKTAFVDACLEEYHQSYFRRYMRNTPVRSSFDIGFTMLLGFVALIIAVCASELIEFSTLGQYRSPVATIVLIITTMIVFAPMMYAYVILIRTYEASKIPLRRIAALVTIAAFVAFICYFKPFGAPVETMSQLTLSLGLIVTIGYATSNAFLKPRQIYQHIFGVVIILGFSPLYFGLDAKSFILELGTVERVIPYILEKLAISTIFENTEAMAWAFLGLSSIFGALLSRAVFLNKLETKSKKDTLKFIIAVSLYYFLFLYLPLTVFGIDNWSEKLLPLLLFIFTVASVSIVFILSLRYVIRLFYRTQSKNRRFVPPFEALLFFKAFFLCVISLQLAFPLLGVFDVLGYVENEKELLDKKSKFKTSTVYASCFQYDNNEGTCIYSLFPAQPQNKDATVVNKNGENQANTTKIKNSTYTKEADKTKRGQYTPSFVRENPEEVLWLILVSIIYGIIFYFELEWVNRPFIKQRQASPLNGGVRSKYEPHHPLDPVWLEDCLPSENDSNFKPMSDHLKDLEKSSKHSFRLFEWATTPAFFAKLWSPVIVVKVNLGFDSLDHRGVVHAMLYGLKEEYHKTFAALRTPYTIICAAVKFVLIMLTVAYISRAFIEMPELNHEDDEIYTVGPRTLPFSGRVDYCKTLVVHNNLNQDTTKNAPLVDTLCELFPSYANVIVDVLFKPIADFGSEVTNDTRSNGKLSYLILHQNQGLPQIVGQDEFKQTLSVTFRVYHLLLTVLFLWLFSNPRGLFALLPYRKTILDIDTLSQSLTMRQTSVSSHGRFSIGKLFGSVLSRDQSDEISRDILDPRTVELSFLALLENIQTSAARGFWPIAGALRVPAPEITFVFDELDKIGGVFNAEIGSVESSPDDTSAIDFERQRAYALHGLLSDMKRMISSAPARFIFVGNRMLHDEYIADSGRRDPLLTSIFDAEIYLPSLLLDKSADQINKRGESNLNNRTREYLYRNYEISQEMYKKAAVNALIPAAGSGGINIVVPSFFEDTPPTDLEIKVFDNKKTASTHHPHSKSNDNSQLMAGIQQQFVEELINFLSYRTKGTPKQLKDTILGYVKPASVLRQDKNIQRQSIENTQDALYFDHRDIYRIQVVDYLCRHVLSRFSEKLVSRDDKATTDVIYLLDYLLKFHSRAFSWSSLERVDELAHIHRAPDLRETFENILELTMGRFLHQVLNGLYTFRYRSEVALEIRYLSRFSENEKAMFNFTLDESQALKATYTTMLNRSGEPNEDIYAALGELYEYDQAYEVARGYYIRALNMNDATFAKYVGEEVDIDNKLRSALQEAVSEFKRANATEPHFGNSDIKRTDLVHSLSIPASINIPTKVPFLKAVLSMDPEGLKNIMYFLPWAIRRLRLMLQIGLTFEQANDLERAQARYFAAHMFSLSLIELAFPSNNSEVKEGNESNEGQDVFWIKQLFKHNNVMFQPAFASAWVAEKLEGGVDTSITMIESYLRELRVQLPFLNFTGEDLSKAVQQDIDGQKGGSSDSNIALVAAEMYNKGGDLYFFKGTEGNHGNRLVSEFSAKTSVHKTGYLSRAIYHYTVALHEVRRYIVYRHQASPYKFGQPDTASGASFHKRGSWPKFVMQQASSNLVDLSESIFATLSVNKLLEILQSTDAIKILTAHHQKFDQTHSSFTEQVTTWFESTDDQIKNTPIHVLNNLGLTELFGIWNLNDNQLEKSYHNIVDRDFETDDINKILIALNLSLVAAKYSYNCGLKRSALDEYILVLEIIQRTIKWLLLTSKHRHINAKTDSPGIQLMATVISRYALIAAQRIDDIAQNSSSPTTYQIGNSVPVAAATVVCGIISSLDNFNKSTITNYSIKRLSIIVDNWFSFNESDKRNLNNYNLNADGNKSSFRNYARSRLIYLMDRHQFPALNGLFRLKTLIDDTYIRATTIDTQTIAMINEADQWLSELIIENDIFDAPSHFVPLMMAETIWLALSIDRSSDQIKMDINSERWQSKMFKYLIKSDQSISMGHEYYKNIRSLYYLFDDFNDRRRHAVHAQHMAGSDVIRLLQR